MSVIRWRKSSRSGGDGNSNCVEVSQYLDAVRDSKNPGGPVLSVDMRPLLSLLASRSGLDTGPS